jgi:hypothetical protein
VRGMKSQSGSGSTTYIDSLRPFAQSSTKSGKVPLIIDEKNLLTWDSQAKSQVLYYCRVSK